MISTTVPWFICTIPETFSKRNHLGCSSLTIRTNSRKRKFFLFSILRFRVFDKEKPWHGGPPIIIKGGSFKKWFLKSTSFIFWHRTSVCLWFLLYVLAALSFTSMAKRIV